MSSIGTIKGRYRYRNSSTPPLEIPPSRSPRTDPKGNEEKHLLFPPLGGLDDDCQNVQKSKNYFS